MVKYVFKRKSGNRITYIYRKGFSTTVKVDYEKFLKDLVKYARVDIDDIETEEDIENLFDITDRKGFSFSKTSDSVNAIKNQYLKTGRIFRKKDEDKQEYLERYSINIIKKKKERKIFRKQIVKKHGRSKKVVRYEEIRILFKVFDDEKNK